MDRDIEIDPQHRTPGPERVNREPVPRETHERDRATMNRHREALPERFARYRISEAEREILAEVGRFRTIAQEDLGKYKYSGDMDRMRQDLRGLIAQGLLRRRTVCVKRNQKLVILALSKEGRNVVEQGRHRDSRQAFYSGFVKPAEIAHDAAIYRMYHAESARIEAKGGRIVRVTLDYELKRTIYKPLAKARLLPPLEYARQQRELAEQNGLKVVGGRIRLPDLRIEYETSAGDLARVDLELATGHYRGSHAQTKAEAGFKMYAVDGSARRLTAALDEREITAEILSL